MKKIIFLIVALMFAGIGAAVAWTVINYQSRETTEEEERQPGFLKTSGEFKDKLGQLKIKRDKAETQIERLETRKQIAAKKIKDLGIRNVSDIPDDSPEPKLLVSELQSLVNDQKKLRADIKIYNDAIVSIEAILRKYDRELVMTGAGISEEQMNEMRTIVLDVDDKITGEQTILEELKTQDLLDEILGDDQKDD